MKNRFLVLMVVLFLALTSGCKPAAVAPVPIEAPAVAPAEAAVAVLEFVSSDGTRTSMTLDQVRALPATEGVAGIKYSTGKITLPGPYKGVFLKDMAASDPKFDNTKGVTLYAVDGYRITLSYDQIMNGTFTHWYFLYPVEPYLFLSLNH